MAAPSSPGSWKQRAAELQQRWQSLAAAAPDDPVLLKASATLQILEDLCLETESFNISSFLQLYSKAILDITFYEENRLVDEDFPDDSSLQKVKDLIQILSEPEVLIKETNLFKKPPVIALEDEVTECLHWRRGALLYMYCHTVRDREDWLLRNKSTFNQCLKDGVCYLLNMLKSQIPVQLNDATFKDPGIAFLLKQGVFSDIHVLALMYCGELCYWTVLHGCEQGHTFNDGLNTECCDETQMTTLNFQEVGINVLEKYVSVCEGPLQGQGWNTENAKNSLQFLKKAGT